MNDITALPHDLFLLVLWYLPPASCIVCRAVSRQWYLIFTDDSLNRLLLRWNFPRCREIRYHMAAASLVPSMTSLPHNLRVELELELQASTANARAWAVVFAEVARRYHHLRSARPRVLEKLPMAGEPFAFRGVQIWNRFLRLEDRTAHFHYPDPYWSYSQEDGVLVFPDGATTSADTIADGNFVDKQRHGYLYQVFDLATREKTAVPFDVRQKLVRRVRLAQGVLIFEWAEATPYHQLNSQEVVHRHYVTAFDVKRCRSPESNEEQDLHPLPGSASRWSWQIQFRSEWKLHFLGLPINQADRFYSAHTATHYAVYFWQPNRSLYNDAPIEQIAVWDITTPSPYLPSEDPTGELQPHSDRISPRPTGLWRGMNGGHVDSVSEGSAAMDESPSSTRSQADKSSLGSALAGPQVIRRMAWGELDFYGIRQRANPQLRNLVLDERNLYFVEEEHRWAEGQHSSLNPPRVHLVRCTGIPVIPTRPILPTSRTLGNSVEQVSRQHNPATDSVPIPANLSSHAAQLEDVAPPITALVNGPVFGPVWLDSCGAEGDINMNFCQRVALPRIQPSLAMPTPLPREGRADRSPWTCANASTSATANTRSPQNAMVSWPWSARDEILPTILPPQPARWPGWAPCWRHEDFPYLTVAEIVDLAAGVRIAARHCFMLETLSVHVRPKLWFRGPGENQAVQVRAGSRGQESSRGGDLLQDAVTATRGRAEAYRDDESEEEYDDGAGTTIETEFPDSLWAELMAKGHIAGDERWVIGEDHSGRLTVLRF